MSNETLNPIQNDESHVISIIIPTWNEAKSIGLLLQYLTENIAEKELIEILVVDCESEDQTREEVNKFMRFYDHCSTQLLISEKGRAKQMNYGAQHASGSVLYFLHADSYPPNHFDTLIRNEIKQNNKAGCFIMRFDSNHWWLKLAGWLTRFKSKACRGGDQSLFITKTLFNELGGYDKKYTVFEDQDFISKLYNKKEFTIIKNWLTTSARRYRSNGIWKLQYHFWAIYIKKFLGASADELYRYYLKNIRN
ncbi:MAG: glycosyltransferase family 2 protein [Flavobacteriaceae bacterium]|nr:glycosyltransferase family 2 protein [Flavobacteriaceae bacterium]